MSASSCFTNAEVFPSTRANFGVEGRKSMKTTVVTVQWEDGIHLRRAGKIAQLATRFRSSILCRLEGKVADARSIISILILCAGLGAVLEIEASGPDEREAIQAIDAFFSSSDDSSKK
jgi:phosphocarrier protein HPr